MGHGTVLSVSTRALLTAYEGLGLDCDALLASVGLTREHVADPDARLPATQVAALFRAAQQQSGDDNLALHAAEALPFGAYKVLDYVALGGPTIADGLQQLARYFPVIHSSARIECIPRGKQVLFRLGFAGTAPPRPYAEYALAAIVLRSRHRWRCRWPVTAVELAYPAPPSDAEHRRIFGGEIRFDRPYTQLVIERTTWEHAVEALDASLFEIVRSRADDEFRRTPREATLLTSVRAAIESLLGKHGVTIASVASRLAITPRTLQRRLSEEKTSFAAELDAVRRDVALEGVERNELSLSEISYLLAYSEPRAFHRAFARWTGTTPTAYRRRAVVKSRRATRASRTRG